MSQGAQDRVSPPTLCLPEKTGLLANLRKLISFEKAAESEDASPDVR